MMTRAQRIEYEILDCAVHGSTGVEGYTVTLAQFLMRLRELFPDIEAHEFTEACRRLVDRDALLVRKLKEGYGGGLDEATFFTDPKAALHFHSGPQSELYFRQLSAFIDMPAAFKHRQESH